MITGEEIIAALERGKKKDDNIEVANEDEKIDIEWKSFV